MRGGSRAACRECVPRAVPKLGRIFVFPVFEDICSPRSRHWPEIRFRRSIVQLAHSQHKESSDSGIFHAMAHYIEFVVLLAAGWINRDQHGSSTISSKRSEPIRNISKAVDSDSPMYRGVGLA